MNLVDIILIIGIAGISALAVRSMIRRRKSGSCGCGCGCDGCSGCDKKR